MKWVLAVSGMVSGSVSTYACNFIGLRATALLMPWQFWTITNDCASLHLCSLKKFTCIINRLKCTIVVQLCGKPAAAAYCSDELQHTTVMVHSLLNTMLDLSRRPYDGRQ